MRIHTLSQIVLAAASFLGALSSMVAAGCDASAYNRAGVERMNRFLYGEAAEEFRKALSADPKYNLARINLGIALYYDQQLDAARQALEEVLAHNPADPYANFSLGLVLRHKGLPDEAEIHFKRVTDVDPKCAAAFYNLGVTQARQGRPKEAEENLRHALELDPVNAGALYNLGSFLVKQGRTREGQELLERFRKLPATADIGAGMGSGPQYGKSGKYALARDERNQAP